MRMAMLDRIQIQKGSAFPIGVSRKGTDGVQIAIWYQGAGSCQLRLYFQGKIRKIKMYPLTEVGMGDIFSVVLSCEGVEEILNNSEYDFVVDGQPATDDYARAVSGRSAFGRNKGKIKNRFVLDSFDWSGENWQKLLSEEMIVYQCHVRGFTRHSSSGVKAPGTFRGVQEKIPYLKELGVNTLFFLPIYDFNECMGAAEDDGSVRVNYWGYTGDAFYFAPKASYSSNPANPSAEFKSLVKALHQQGMNIMLDMYFTDRTQDFVLSCLRFYVLQFHIDGFYINYDGIDMESLRRDPVLSHVKIIGNGWDERVRSNAHEMFYEMNDGFMIDARRFLKSDEGQVSSFYHQFIKQTQGVSQIHYITQHNGFTLRDLISYDVKHNEANGERNLDGTQYNYSWNCGVEGSTRRRPILRMRKQQEKNALVMLFLGMAVPMLLSGDEFGNSQKGNNNAYCQDNATTWLNWKLLERNQETFAFAKRMITFRKEHSLYHQKKMLSGADLSGKGAPDVSCHGREPWVADFSYYSRELGILFFGEYYQGKSLYFAFNFHWDEHEFFLPKVEGEQWNVVIETVERGESAVVDGRYMMAPRSITIFESVCIRQVKTGRKNKQTKKKNSR